MRHNFTLLFAGLLLFLTYTTFAQSSPVSTLFCSDSLCKRTCVTPTYLLEQLRQDTALVHRMEEIERHTQTYINQKQIGIRSHLTIPVVVHIVARNATENISDQQIHSQIDVLNRDFNQLNGDIEKVPSVFQDRIANCGIEFCLARRTPEGFPTNGIVRTRTTRANPWLQNDDVKYTNKGGDNAWDAQNYLNIWVCPIENDILGYASFPGYIGTSDGVVISYKAFGIMGTAQPPYNLGRTSVHEIGHWLNLYHIWGDDICGDDRVSDTPPQHNATYGPNGYPRYDQCQTERNLVMSMNFMDYCYDDQMFFFTKGQKQRIWSLFDAGGNRAKLAYSKGCEPVTMLTCKQVQTPEVLNIGMDSALVRWLPMDGVQAYNLMYSLDSSGVWMTQKIDNGTTNFTLKRLLAAKLYKVKIQALNCADAAWSNIAIFNTKVIDSQNCERSFLNNTSFEKAAVIANDISIQSQLISEKDEDWFKININPDKPFCKIILSQLFKDYDIRVYNSKKKLINASIEAGLSEEEIILNKNTEGGFWLQVVGYLGAFNPNECYTLTINTAATPFFSLSKSTLSSPDVALNGVLIYPNPARGEVYIAPDLQTIVGATHITLTNLRGQKCSEHLFEFSKSTPQLTLDIEGLASGLYFLTFRTATAFKTEKLLIQN